MPVLSRTKYDIMDGVKTKGTIIITALGAALSVAAATWHVDNEGGDDAADGWRVDGMVCLDVGSSTGGFTDCLLQHGARRHGREFHLAQADTPPRCPRCCCPAARWCRS